MINDVKTYILGNAFNNSNLDIQKGIQIWVTC